MSRVLLIASSVWRPRLSMLLDGRTRWIRAAVIHGCLGVFPSVCLSVCLSACLFVCLFRRRCTFVNLSIAIECNLKMSFM